MKNLTISMLAIASIFCSCSKESDLIDGANPNGNNEKVEIKLNAGVVGVTTKTALESWEQDGTKVQFAYGTDGTNFSEAWNAIMTRGSNAVAFKADNFTDDASHYYDTEETNKTYLIGYYPKLVSGQTITSNQIPFAITGKEDIMASEMKYGNRTTPIDGSFTFNHLLAQLKFKLAKGTSFGEGVTVTKIMVNGTKNSAVLQLSNPTKLDFTAGTSTPLEAYTGSTTIPTADETTIGEIMIEPDVPVTLDIETSAGKYTGIAVNIADGGNPVQSNAYTITLTFSKKTVQTEAAIGTWVAKTGSATIE